MRYGWALEKDKWNNLQTIIAGTTWSKVLFDKLYSTLVPDEPGIYAICAKIKYFDQSPFRDLYNIIYVGMDRVSLRRRFIEHLRIPKKEICQAFTCFGWDLDYHYATADQTLVVQMEGHLISCLGPPANLVSGHIPATIGPGRRA